MPTYRGVDEDELLEPVVSPPPQPQNDEDIRLVCKALNILLYDFVDADDPEIGFTAMDWIVGLSRVDDRFGRILWDGHRKMFATSIFEKQGVVIR